MSEERREDARTPVQLRVRLHQADLAAWLDAQAANLSATGIFLAGVAARPAGTVIRFELLLTNGTPALRGEGTVVWSRGEGRSAGVALRFSRLDGRSKKLLDELRERGRIRAGSIPPPVAVSMAPAQETINVVRLSAVPRAAPLPAFAAETQGVHLPTLDRQLDALACGLALAVAPAPRLALGRIDDSLEALAAELPRADGSGSRSGLRLSVRSSGR